MRCILLQLYAGFGEDFQRERVRIALLVDNPSYAGIYYHLGADRAGLVSAVQRRPIYGYTKLSSLNDSILLGMYGIT